MIGSGDCGGLGKTDLQYLIIRYLILGVCSGEARVGIAAPGNRLIALMNLLTYCREWLGVLYPVEI